MNWVIGVVLGVVFLGGGISLTVYKMYLDSLPKPGECYKELNKRYSSSSNAQGTIYRVEELKEDSIAVSSYDMGSWFFLKAKPLDYFKDNKTFSYEKVVCPDRAGDRDNMRAKDIKFFGK